MCRCWLRCTVCHCPLLCSYSTSKKPCPSHTKGPKALQCEVCARTWGSARINIRERSKRSSAGDETFSCTSNSHNNIFHLSKRSAPSGSRPNLSIAHSLFNAAAVWGDRTANHNIQTAWSVWDSNASTLVDDISETDAERNARLIGESEHEQIERLTSEAAEYYEKL